MRKAFLQQRPLCEAHPILHPGTIHSEPAVHIHHMAGRYQGNYLNRDTWLPTCFLCHEWIHHHPKQARALNLLK